MRRRVAALLVAAVLVLVALMLAGCGGGGGAEAAGAGTEPAPAETPAAAPAPPPVVAADAGAPSLGLSPKEIVSEGETFPANPEALPAAVDAALKSRQPMLVFFYASTADVTKEQKAEIDASVLKYRGLIDVVSFDLAAPTTAKGDKGKAARQAVLLATQLKVSTVPYIVMTDADGRITWRIRGYVDRGIIEREILRATQ